MDGGSPSQGEVKELISKWWDEQLLKVLLNLKYLSNIKYKKIDLIAYLNIFKLNWKYNQNEKSTNYLDE